MLITTSNNRFPYGLGERHLDIQTTGMLIDSLSSPIQKSASSGSNVMAAVVKALSGMGVKANIDLSELLKRLSDDPMMKNASEEKTSDSEEETIRIASKKIKDSHYFFDITKDRVSKNGKSLILVAALMREGYLGRYLIKRNYWFLPDNNTEASDVYNELRKRCQRVRRRYYDEKIAVNGIFPEVKAFLDGTRGDLEDIEEDNVGTAHYRNKETGHTLEGPSYIKSDV